MSRAYWLLLVALLLCLCQAVGQAEDLSWLNPEKLPPQLKHPLKLLATTRMSGEGQDYYSLKPGATATIGTVTGPAILFRVWSTSSEMKSTSLEMIVDGKKETLYAKGALPASAAKDDPLRTMDGQAYWSYIPVFVKKQAVFKAQSFAKAATEPMKFYLQVGYRQVPAAELAEAARLNLKEVRQQAEMWTRTAAAAGAAREVLGSMQSGQPWQPQLAGPCLVTALQILRQGQNGAPAPTPEQLQATRLVVQCDGVRTIDVPLASLISVRHKATPHYSAGSSTDGSWLNLQFPLPIASSLSVGLEPFGSGGITSADARLLVLPLKAASKYRLCAQYFSQLSVQDQPMTLLNVTGEGIFVGTNLSVNGLERKTFAFLEGNEQIYIDGDTKPTIEGTGTEDYFNNAWYFASGEKTHLFSGVTFKQDREPPMVDCYRYMISDCIPFAKSFRFDLQHGSRNKAPNVLYEGVMFWYQASPTNVAEPVAAKAPAESGGPAQPERRQGGMPMVIGFVIALVVVGLVAWRVLRRKA